MLYIYENGRLQHGFWVFMLKNEKIHFFTGKGGVGKSTLSVAFARELANAGHKTLWLEFSQTPTQKHFPEVQLEFKPQQVSENLSVASWNGEDCLQEFVRHSVKLRMIFEAFYRSKAINALIKAAPALREISFLGYLTSHLRQNEPSLDFDQVVVDAPSTGHFLACLKVPSALLDVSDFGPMGKQCRGILDVLKDPQKTAIYSVFIAEPLVFLEYEYLQAELQALGFQSKPWLNKALNPEIVNELNSLESEKNSYLEKIILRQKNEKEIVEKINSKSLNLIYEDKDAVVKKQVKDIFKRMSSGEK